MEQLKIAFYLYFFLLLVAAGFAGAAALAFYEYRSYAFSAALFIHSVVMTVIFVQFAREKAPEKPAGGSA